MGEPAPVLEIRAQTFRRSKLIKWMKLEIKITEGLMRSDANENFINARNDMLESLMKEFGIGWDELQE